jgi:hypothetical protein
MNEEFRRFGLTDNQRKLTGIFQLLGSIGLLSSFIISWLGLLSALGLTIMMLVAFAVRIRIKDSLAQTVPSLVFLILNAWVTHALYSLI